MTTVDGELFDTLEAAVEFVATRGGGTIYTQAAGTMYAESLVQQHPTVQIARPRQEDQ